MPDVLEPPSAPRVHATPQSAIANFINLDRIQTAEPEPQPAAPPPPPKKPAPPTAPPDEKPPTNAAKWKEFVESREKGFKEREDRITTLQTEIETSKKQAAQLPASDPEKETLRKEIKELSAQLYAVGRERHPAFKVKYDAAIAEKVGDVERLVGGDEGKKLAKLIAGPDFEGKKERIKELLVDVDELDRPLVRHAWLEIEKLSESRQKEIETSLEDFDKLIVEHKANDAAASQKAAKDQRDTIDKMFGAALATYQDKEKGLAELTEKDGDEPWNGKVKTVLARAKSILYGEAKPEEVLAAVFHDAAFEPIKAERDTLRDELKKANGQIRALSGASPGLRQPGAAAPTTQQIMRNVSLTPKQAMANWEKMLKQESE